MSTADDVIARINRDVDAWEYRDAARWNPDIVLAPERAASRLQFGAPRVFIGDEAITVTAIEFDTVPAPPLGAGVYRAVAAFEQQMLMLSTYSATFTTALANVAQTAASFARALGLKPCDLGVRPCFCHPEPFPAARDYRRRTKHRNRRRRP